MRLFRFSNWNGTPVYTQELGYQVILMPTLIYLTFNLLMLALLLDKIDLITVTILFSCFTRRMPQFKMVIEMKVVSILFKSLIIQLISGVALLIYN